MVDRYRATLPRAERDQIAGPTRRGSSTAARSIHARALLLCDAGEFGDPWKFAAAQGVSSRTVQHLKQSFLEDGLVPARVRRLSSNPWRPVYDGEFDAWLTALACFPAPEGNRRWTVRLLAHRLVELKIEGKGSPMTVQRSLKTANGALT